MLFGKKRNKRQSGRTLQVLMGWLVAGFIMILWSASLTAAELKVDSEASSCKDCHKQQAVLPAEHPDVNNMDYSKCIECHSAKGVNMAHPLPLGHIHLLSGIGCGDCHNDLTNISPVSMDVCLECHGSAQEVADQTAQFNPNPHDSPHYGIDLDCTLCHHQHQPSELFCSQCHDFDIMVP